MWTPCAFAFLCFVCAFNGVAIHSVNGKQIAALLQNTCAFCVALLLFVFVEWCVSFVRYLGFLCVCACVGLLCVCVCVCVSALA